MLEKNTKLRSQLTETIRKYNEKGWSPATSTNYSFREKHSDTEFFVSKSGIDKSEFSDEHFMVVDANGRATAEYKDIKSSAETLIHCVLYQLFPKTTVILHSHSIYSVLNSQKYTEQIHFKGYEIQKGFSGQSTHENLISIPIFENSQYMDEFVKLLKNNHLLLNNHCFIIKNHGVYAWGENLFEAKRHLETIEYLLEVNWKLNH